MDKIDVNDIKSILTNIDKDTIETYGNKVDYIITLTNGKSFISGIVVQENTNSLINEKDCIEITLSPQHSIYIPLSDISGLLQVCIKQEINIIEGAEPVFDNKGQGVSLYDLAKESILSNANYYKWESNFHHVAFSLGKSKPFQWGNLIFEDDTPLYCDKEYINQQNSRKINSFGAGLLGFSASVGWTKEGHWNDFKKMFKIKPVELGMPLEKYPVHISGYIDFIEANEKISGDKMVLKMEGAQWYPAIVAKSSLKNINFSADSTWQYCYFKEDSYFIDKDLWLNIVNSISLICEYIPVNLKTEYGERPGILKVRAAASFKSA